MKLIVVAISIMVTFSSVHASSSDCDILRPLLRRVWENLGQYGNDLNTNASYLFRKRRDAANADAQTILNASRSLQEKSFQVGLVQIANSILNFQQSGNGNMFYWTEVVRRQNRHFEKEYLNLKSIRDVACR
jgi:hypothetical protein